MEKKSDSFSMQEAMRFARSPAGQQLLETLQQSDPDAVKKAMQQASSGDFSQMQDTLKHILASEEIKKLLKQFGG